MKKDKLKRELSDFADYCNTNGGSTWCSIPKFAIDNYLNQVDFKPDEADEMLFKPLFWNKERTQWTQPPVKIKHGDLVEIEYPTGITVLGRYIGKGMGGS
jgi:hypothetical protein